MSKIFSNIRSKKSGVALGETATMIVVIGALSVVSYVQIRKVLKMSEVRSAVGEYNTYKQAIIGFQGAYGYLPGDVPLDKLGGALSLTKDNADYASKRSEPGEEMANGRIGVKYGARLAFQQLAVGGFIESSLVQSSKINFQTDSNKLEMKIAAGYSLPIANFSKKAIWYLTTEEANGDYKIAPAIIQNSSLQSWKGKVKLHLVSHANSRGRHEPSYRDNDTVASAPELGSMSPDFAYSVDIKMDDGSPTKASGAMIADDSFGYPEVCRTKESDIEDSIYKDTSSGKTSTQCVVAFAID